MKSQTLLGQFERLERLIDKLPEGLRKPILHEIVPLKELFLQQRPPRLVFAGDSSVEVSTLFSALFSLPLEPDDLPGRGWQEFSRRGRGAIRVLDARGGSGLSDTARVALSAEAPDIVIFLRGVNATGEPAFDELKVLKQFVHDRHGSEPSVVGVCTAGAAENPDPAELAAARRKLELNLTDRPDLGGHLVPAVAVATAVRFRPDGTVDANTDRRIGVEELADLLVAELPNEAKLEMARLSGAKHSQSEIARTMVKSVAAACAAIGAQPIPLADLPFMLALQILMVSGILYISGREASFRLGAEFLGTLGVSFGAGYAFREVARSLLKIFPGWGSAISGLVAATGTYALGRTATAYYIEGLSLREAKKLFRRARKEKALPPSPPDSKSDGADRKKP